MRIPFTSFLFAYILFTIIPYNAVCQQERTNYLGIDFGAGNLHILDEAASPLIYSRTGISPSLNYFRKKENSRQYAEASFSYFNLKTTQDNFNARSYIGRIRYSFAYSVLSPERERKKLNIFAGGSLTSFFSKTDYDYEKYYNSSMGRAISSWYWCHSLDLAIQAEYDLPSGGFLSGQLYLPLISNVSRPTYSSSGDYNYSTNRRDVSLTGATFLFPENFSFDAVFVYQRPLTARINIQASWEFYYAQYDKPRELKMFTNNFRAGLVCCF